MELAEIVRLALDEDLGAGDVTSLATVAEDARAVATITQKAPGVISGLEVAELAFTALDPSATLVRLCDEGEWREGGEVLRVEGATRAILGAERVALNFLAHLGGVATLTARYVAAIEGTGVRILDTRKTTPGLRALEKAAVRAGGGVSHRWGLYDEVLIKENHIAAAGGVGEAVRRAQAAYPDLSVEVECETPAEIAEALDAGAPKILLDNMTPAEMEAAVVQNRAHPTPAKLEASGGITLETVRAKAVPGLDWVSVGALTHSAPALDLSLLIKAVP
jgi:nicotinate-nucleotide pyrophosphorylase (carboxylating)